MNLTSLDPFFSPRGIAVIGASQDPTKLGYGLARNLVKSQYQGAIHLVNPRGGQLFNRQVYTSIMEVPDPVDLAVLLIPANVVAEIFNRMRSARDKSGCHWRWWLQRGRTTRRSFRARMPANCKRVRHAIDWA